VTRRGYRSEGSERGATGRMRATLAILLTIGAAAVIALGAGAIPGFDPGRSAPGRAGSTPPAPAPTSGIAPAAAVVLLADLPVKGRAPGTGYDREGRFGEAWLDVDGNGCDTRDDVLARDLDDVLRDGPCRVVRGVLHDPYTGRVIPFQRGEATSPDVQIDHVVALSDAWQKGAQQLTDDQRVAFANDPRNLLAVDGPINTEKGDGDAATWLPPERAFRCDYVARQVDVKAAYGLWVTPAEHDAIARVLADCG
jgi:hypothetical protein